MSSRPRRPFAHLRHAADDVVGSPRLTPRQRQILDWIRGFIEARGMPPTRAEIAAGLGFSTPSSAEARSGQIVVARIEDEVPVKRFRRRGREIVLSPENLDLEAIVVDPKKIA